MSEQINATCSICGNGYHLCISCKDYMKLHPWKIHTDSASCYQVFQVVKGYNTGVYTKEEAKIKLKNVNLNDVESFRPHIKKIVKDILREKHVVKQIEKVEPTMEKTEVATEENAAAEKTTVSRKKNYKVNSEVKETEDLLV